MAVYHINNDNIAVAPMREWTIRFTASDILIADDGRHKSTEIFCYINLYFNIVSCV